MTITLLRNVPKESSPRGFVSKRTFHGHTILVANAEQYAYAMKKVSSMLAKSTA